MHIDIVFIPGTNLARYIRLDKYLANVNESTGSVTGFKIGGQWGRGYCLVDNGQAAISNGLRRKSKEDLQDSRNQSK